MADSERKSQWPKVLAIGCGTVLLFAVAIAAAVAWNWPRLTGIYHRATATFSEMMQVAAALQGKYGGTVNVMAKHEGGAEGTVLSVTLTNPPFLEQLNLDGPSAKQKALEVATAARDALPAGSEYAAYEVVLSRQRGAGLTLTTRTAFRFQANELSPRAR